MYANGYTCETVYWSAGVGFVRRGFSFIFFFEPLVYTCFFESRDSLCQASSPNKCCVFVRNLSTFQVYIICPTQTTTRQHKPQGARISDQFPLPDTLGTYSRASGGVNKGTSLRKSEGIPRVSTRFSLSVENEQANAGRDVRTCLAEPKS